MGCVRVFGSSFEIRMLLRRTTSLRRQVSAAPSRRQTLLRTSRLAHSSSNDERNAAGLYGVLQKRWSAFVQSSPAAASVFPASLPTTDATPLYALLKKRWALSTPTIKALHVSTAAHGPSTQDVLAAMERDDMSLVAATRSHETILSALQHVLAQASPSSTHLPAVLQHAVDARVVLPLDVVLACIDRAASSDASLARTLVLAIADDLTPRLPSPSAVSLANACMRVHAMDAAALLFSSLRGRGERLPPDTALLLTCILDLVESGISSRRQRYCGILLDMYLVTPRRDMAPSVLAIYSQRYRHIRPPAALLNRLGRDFVRTRQDATPLLDYAIATRAPLESSVVLGWLQATSTDDAGAVEAAVSRVRQYIDAMPATPTQRLVCGAMRLCLQSHRIPLAVALHAAYPIQWDDDNDDATHPMDAALPWLLAAMPTDPLAAANLAAFYLHAKPTIEATLAMRDVDKSNGMPPAILVRKWGHALAAHGHFGGLLELLGQLPHGSDLSSTPAMELWKLYFTKAPSATVVAALDLFASVDQPSVDATAAALAAALDIHAFDTAIALAANVDRTALPPALAAVLSALAAPTTDAAARIRLVDYFVRQDVTQTSAVFETLVAAKVDVTDIQLRQMLHHVVRTHDMVAAHAMLAFAQATSTPLTSDVFTRCFAEHQRSKQDPAAFVSLFMDLSTFGLVEDNTIVYQAAIRGCIAVKNFNLAWKIATRAESRGIFVEHHLLEKLDKMSS
ncbi:Aste57867_13259 [Aphanomyces stellatus]|uniref:Aste57867_13259 protein n=1 Tax=Aphanomyces stellatus TaxID=120398 RepID=A0A485KXN5_9STRA|nr:hypothetical protein As57867_013210 [Aphanomyces stellatus]VFT90099.1 Aste57867_13259 [Aphanomyces stellatus]